MHIWGPSWSWSHGSWIYIYLFNQCLSPLMCVRISIRARCTPICDKVCQWLATSRWFSPGPSVSSTNKTDRHDITEILLKVTLSTIKQTNKQTYYQFEGPSQTLMLFYLVFVSMWSYKRVCFCLFFSIINRFVESFVN
jgi:hypothetical protein